MKKVVVLFNAPGFSPSHYDQVWDDLIAAGMSHPKGLISHAGFERTDGSIGVVDIWESAEAFTEFGRTLVPIIKRTGIAVPEPMVFPAHYVFVGQPEHEHV